MKKHYVLIEFETDKPIADLTDKIAGRIYTMDGVKNSQDVTASVLNDQTAEFLAFWNRNPKKRGEIENNTLPL